MITNDKRIESLYKFYFKWLDTSRSDIKHYLKIASDRAYRDLCRTLTWISKLNNSSVLRTEVNDLFYINFLKLNKITNQNDFDKNFHNKICKDIIRIYKDFKKIDHRWHEIIFTYWHSQKWLNMTLKYLFILNHNNILKDIDKIYKFCHMPIDSIILKELFSKNIIDESTSKKAWSKLSVNEYYSILKEIVNYIEDKYDSMLDLEIEIWNP